MRTNRQNIPLVSYELRANNRSAQIASSGTSPPGMSKQAHTHREWDLFLAAERQTLQAGRWGRLGACLWDVTAQSDRQAAKKRCRNEPRWMKGREFSLYQKEASVVFLIYYDFKVQKSVFLFFFFLPLILAAELPLLPYHTSHLRGSRQKKKEKKKNTAGTEVESHARQRFDKLDFAVIDAESTAET